MKELRIPIPQKTIDWLNGRQGEEMLTRQVESACKTFLEPGLTERLIHEFENSKQGGTKLFRIGNSLRGLSSTLAVIALGHALGIEIPELVWETIDSPYLNILLSVGEMNFQGKTQKNPDWKSDLWTADIGANLALVYHLNPPISLNRSEFNDFIKERCFKPIIADWVDDSTRIHSLDSMGHNWWAVIVGGAGIIASLMNLEEYKKPIFENLQTWFHYPGSEFSRKHPNFGDNGDFLEGFGYAEYALQNPFRLSLVNHDFNIVPDCLSDKQVHGLADWFLHAFTETVNGYKPFLFGDIHSGYRPSPEIFHTLARLTGNDNLLALAHHLSPEPGNAFSFLAWEPATQSPDLPRHVRSPEPLVYKTSGIAFIEGDDMSLAVRAGEFWNHSHLDAGSFIFKDQGVVWIDDSGTCEYSRPEYSNFYVMAQAHNVSFATQLAPEAGRIQYEGSPHNGRYLANAGDDLVQLVQVDTNILNRGALLRSMRSFIMLDGEALLIWDDLAAYDDQSFEYLLHTACEVDTSDNPLIRLVQSERFCPLWLFSSSDSELTADTDIAGKKLLRWQTSPETRQKFGLVLGSRVKSAQWEQNPAGGWECSIETDQNRWNMLFNHRADGSVMHQNCIIRWQDIESDAYALILNEEKKTLTAIQGSFARTSSGVLYSNLSRQPLVSLELSD